MGMLINPYGFGAAAAVADVTLTAAAASYSLGGSGSSWTYTLATQALGADDANRMILVAIGLGTGVSHSISGCSVQGISGIQVNVANGASNGNCALYRVAVPTGTTGTVIFNVTGGGTPSAGIAAVYRAIPASMTPTSSNNGGADSTADNVTYQVSSVGTGVAGFQLGVGSTHGAFSLFDATGLGTLIAGTNATKTVTNLGFAASAYYASGTNLGTWECATGNAQDKRICAGAWV